MLKLGFLVNPIAGIGGRVGLKGSDGLETIEQAVELGGKPAAPESALEFLQALVSFNGKIYTCGGAMGEDHLEKAGMTNYDIVYKSDNPSTAKDTEDGVAELAKAGVDIIAFCGGDGTARDVYSALNDALPVIGIPAGVKMYSSVFAISPKAAAMAIQTFAGNTESLADAEIMDADEELLRSGELAISLFGIVKTPFDQANIQRAKSPSSPDEAEFAEAIAKSLAEEIEGNPDMVYILGPGTVKTALMKELGLGSETSFLGIDAIHNKKSIGLDLNENKLLDILDKNPKASIVITPIGAQGFVFGRGNQQISEKIIKMVGPDNIIIVATPHKLAITPRLLIHTGDKDLDEKLSGFKKILNGYRNWEMRKVESA